MDTLEPSSETLWADLTATSLLPIELCEIVDLFAVVTRGATSKEAARRLGPAHAVVGGRYTMTPERSALVAVVAAYLTAPVLSERWFGYSPSEPEADAFAPLAAGALALDLMVFVIEEAEG